MSLQFVVGGSGSGKSHWLYTSVIQEAMQHPEINYVIIVPEQFTMQTQRELVRLHPAHGILNIDILSFQRLAYRVFEETGTGRETVLTETGKNLLLRRVAAVVKEDLPIFGSRLDKPGYLSEMKSILSEFTQYEISDGELEAMIELAETKPQLQYKLRDIRILRQAFREYQKDRFITAEEVLDVFCQAAGRSAMLRRSVLAFDGFTGFTPVQLKALGKLLELSPKLMVTVTLDAREKLTGTFREHELFSMSKKMLHSLEQLARETAAELLEPVILTGERGRFWLNPELRFLEQNLFRYGRIPSCTEETSSISIHTAANPSEEVAYAACTIRRLVREQGLRYREIAVIAGDLPSYANYVRKQFEEYEIPCFVDQTVQVLLNPCLEFIRGAFGMIDTDFSYESVLRFLRTGFAGLDETETDRLENYILARGLRGRSMWEQEWTERTKSLSEEEAAKCNGYRARLMERLRFWIENGRKNRNRLQDYVEALYDLLVEFRIQEQLKVREEAFHREGEPEKEKEYKQIYRILIGLLDEAVDLLGDETVTRKEFEEILEAGFAEAKIGIIPPGIDQVLVGDMERTRIGQVRVLFFLGLNDGWVPAREGRGGIVSELEREFLQTAGVNLAPTARENGYIQRYYLYLTMTKPRERLYLSFSKSSSDGSALRPSYLISAVRKLFGQLEVEDEEIRSDPLERAATRKTGLSVLAQSLRRSREEDREGQKGFVRELLRQYRLQEDYRERVEELVEAAFLVYRDQKLEGNTAAQLYGEMLENSVTRLEQFASCAFAHFADYGLHLSEREEYQVRSVDIGNIFHRALELFAEKLERSGYDWFHVPEQVREELTGQSVEEAVNSYGSGIFFASARNQYTIERMKRILRRSVWAMHEQVKAGSFVPDGFEVSFTETEDLSAVNIALSETEKMRLRGRIDRIDVCEEEEKVYVKVIDYKSGNTSFDLVSLYYGLQLQLVVYLNAALEMERKLHPEKEIVPAGIFYYRLKDPVADGAHAQTPEEINEMLLKKLRPDGIVNDDPAVVEKLDAGFEKTSLVIPVGKKADGSWSAVSSVASGRQLGQLSGFVQHKLQRLGKDILKGEIKVNPYQRKKSTSCDYCVFSDLCGFDRKIPGSAFRRLREFSDEEIWEKLPDKTSGEVVS